MKEIVCIFLAVIFLLTGCAAPTQLKNVKSEPVTLTLGGIGMIGKPIEASIKEFNKSQDQVIVVLRDYADLAEGGNYEQAATMLTTEVLSGHAPDLLYFPGSWFLGSDTEDILSPLPFIGQNLLLDLDPMLEQDSELSANDLLIWKALHQYGGMYLLSDRFTIQTVLCSQAFYEQNRNWTIQDYLDLEANLPDGSRMMDAMNPTYLMRSIGCRYMQQALDVSHAVCDFDNEMFISILTSAASVKESDPTEGTTGVTVQMLEGTLMGCYTELAVPGNIAFDRAEAGIDTPMAYIGWPTPDGSCGSDVRLPGAVAIVSGTDNPDACWQFIRYYVMNPYMDERSIHGAGGMGPECGSPIYIPALPKYPEKPEKNTRLQILQQDADTLWAIASQCDTMSYYDEVIMKLILEEANEMLLGNATPEETAKHIQVRASLYMQEKYG